MAVFRDLLQRKNDVSDRSAGDRARNRELVKEIMKEHLPDIITEEIIFNTSGKRKVKVPMRSVKEWRFIYSDRNEGVGQGEGNQPGDVIGSVDDADGGDKPNPGEGGNEAGDIIISEMEVDLDEILDLMFEDLGLPFLEHKKFHEIEVESESKWEGLREQGIEPRLDLEESFIEKLKRQKMLEAKLIKLDPDSKEALQLQEELEKKPFPFREEDFRYHRVTVKTKEESNALIIAIMDISGSMDEDKRYLAKAFLLILDHFIKTKYRRAEIRFIGHHTEAFEVSEYDFFNLSDSGGTNISSGPLKALDLIKTLYPPELWNIYVIHCSDGENFIDDNERAINAYKELVEIVNLAGFVEIKSGGQWSTIGDSLREAIKDPHFQVVKIKEKGQVWTRFIDFMNCDKKYRE